MEEVKILKAINIIEKSNLKVAEKKHLLHMIKAIKHSTNGPKKMFGAPPKVSTYDNKMS